MQTKGIHLLLEYWECDSAILNDLTHIQALMCEAARVAGASIVGSIFRPFYPHGVTGVVVVEESHLSIHTWPEHGYAAVDVFTCGLCKPDKAHEFLLKGLRASSYSKDRILRGNPNTPRLRVVPPD